MLIDTTCQVSGSSPWSNQIHINLKQITASCFLWNQKQNHFSKVLLISIWQIHFFYFFETKIVKVSRLVQFCNLFTVPCLLAAVICSSASKKIQHQHSSKQDSDSLCTSHCYMAYSFLIYYFTSLLKNFTIILKLSLSISFYTHILSFLSLCTL